MIAATATVCFQSLENSPGLDFDTARQSFTSNRFLREAVRSHDKEGPRKKVAIVGAGVAGLVCALELSKLHHDVTLFESGSRVGGRVKTHYFTKDDFAELGAMRIPSIHETTLHYVDLLGLSEGLRPFSSYDPQGVLYLRGTRGSMGMPGAVLDRFRLLTSERMTPKELLTQVMFKGVQSLSRVEFESAFSDTLSGRMAEFGAITTEQFLYRHFSCDAVEYLCHGCGLHGYRHSSFAEVLADLFSLCCDRFFSLSGGMSTLTNAFGERLGARVRSGTSVQAISINGHGAVLSLQSGCKTESFEADYVVVAVPARAVAEIRFEPGLPPEQLQAFRSVNYELATKSVALASKPFWTKGGSSITDEVIEKAIYPSPYDGLPNRAFTASYATGHNAEFLGALCDQTRTNVIKKGISVLHPESNGLIEEVVHASWDVRNGGGAVTYFAPHEHNRLKKILKRSHPFESPVVFFAGEHVSDVHGWIEGALRSGILAAIQVASTVPQLTAHRVTSSVH